MKPNNILTTSIVLQWLFFAVSAFAGWREQSRFTGVFEECRNALNAQHFTSFQIALILFGVGLVIVNLVASVGLCKLKHWSRSLYLWSTIAGTVTVLIFFEPDITTPVSCFFDGWGTIFIGITISLMYWSPLASEFEINFQQSGPGYPPQGVGSPDP